MKYITEFVRLFLGVPIALVASSFYALSIAQQYNPTLGSYLSTYFVAMAIGSTGSMLNILARTFDHCGNPQKIRNQRFGIASLVLQLTQIGLGIAYTYGFNMQVAISPLMSSLGMFLSEGLHWRKQPTWNQSYEQNKGRYIGFGVGGISVFFSILSMTYSSNPIYFVASAFFDAFVIAGLFNRKKDIEVQTDPNDVIDDQSECSCNKNGQCNKNMIRLYTILIALMFIINLSLSGINLFSNTNYLLPIAFPNCVLLTCLPLYLFAQSKLSLLPSMYTGICEEASNACTKISGCFRSCWNGVTNVLGNCIRPVCNKFSKMVNICCNRSVGVMQHAPEAQETYQSAPSVSHLESATINEHLIPSRNRLGDTFLPSWRRDIKPDMSYARLLDGLDYSFYASTSDVTKVITDHPASGVDHSMGTVSEIPVRQTESLSAGPGVGAPIMSPV